MQKICFALDLVNDEELIKEYKKHHQNFWPELVDEVKEMGILRLELYNIADRLFMIWEVEDDFNLNEMRPGSEKNQAWERLMSGYQKPLSIARKGEKWIRMDRIFFLDFI